MRLIVSAVCLSLVVGCGRSDGPLTVEPNTDFAAVVKVTPEPGPFNGEIVITFESSPDATIYLSTNDNDPRFVADGRISGPSPLTLSIKATTTIKYFASAAGKDGPLAEGTWTRAGGPKGTISGVVVVGSFAVDKALGVYRNNTLLSLAPVTAPGEIPFSFTALSSGTHRLNAIADRNKDGSLTRFIDFQSDTTTIELDLTDPFKAGPDNVRLYLGASTSGLGTLKGTIALPRPPSFQNLQVSALDPGALSGGLDPMALLQQLQGGYRVFTNQTDTSYPYVITDLNPGQVIPVASLIGFGNGGVALNLLANPLRPATIVADEETVADFAFGPVRISGSVAVGSMSAPTGTFGFGVVGAKSISFTQGGQAVLMPVIFTEDPMTQTFHATYSGSAFRADSTVNLRVFTNAGGKNPLTDALTWVLNPLASEPAHATVNTHSDDVVQDITVP